MLIGLHRTSNAGCLLLMSILLFSCIYCSFEDREIRDQCSEVGLDYQPPDFVVNALQHTTVQCSWDEGEKDRERKLTNISQWRQLQESELLQYVASSDSDDEEEEGEGDEDSEEDSDDGSDTAGVVSRSTTTKKASAGSQRKQRWVTLLLWLIMTALLYSRARHRTSPQCTKLHCTVLHRIGLN